jgi:DNA-directed RNA polymerase subunit M/transcription elongation factor TFIIS
MTTNNTTPAIAPTECVIYYRHSLGDKRFIDSNIRPLLENLGLDESVVSLLDLSTNKDDLYQQIGLLIQMVVDKKTLPSKLELFDSVYVEDINRHIQYERDVLKFSPTVSVSINSCRNPKCKSKRVMSSQIQNRSGDEGFTNKLVCLECNYRWTERN